jgi:multicomponent Na+:H+ antiporter subunit E
MSPAPRIVRPALDTLPRASGPAAWLRRALGFFAFGWHFTREVVVANIAVAKTVLLQKRDDLAPGFLRYDLTGLGPFEIVVLTHCITLTPGTTSVEVSDDQTTLLVHALDARDPDGVRASILNGLEKPILAWTR